MHIYIYTLLHIYSTISPLYIYCLTYVYILLFIARARTSPPKLIGMTEHHVAARHGTCNVCLCWHGNSLMHLDHMVSDEHHWLVNLKLLDRAVLWCRYCHGPVDEPLAMHLVSYNHVTYMHQTVCPDAYYNEPRNFIAPCAPEKCFVMHREPQLAMTPALKSQCLKLYADDLYKRHMAMHPRYHFGAAVAREGDEDQEVILEVEDEEQEEVLSPQLSISDEDAEVIN